MADKKKKKELRSTWVSTRVSNSELDAIKKLVEDGKYSSQSEALRSGAKLVILIENGKLEGIADVLREAREDAEKSKGTDSNDD